MWWRHGTDVKERNTVLSKEEGGRRNELAMFGRLFAISGG